LPAIPTTKDGVRLMNPERTPRRPRLTLKAEKILRALLEQTTHDKAAAAAGVSTTTIWRYLNKPKFRRALADAQREALSQTTGRLRQEYTLATSALLRIVADPAAPTASRVRAAISVRDHTIHTVQTDGIEVRLLELEKFSGRQGPRSPKRDQPAGPSADLKKAA
jgi:predicted DNA-binding protein (UPF0251 family)